VGTCRRPRRPGRIPPDGASRPLARTSNAPGSWCAGPRSCNCASRSPVGSRSWPGSATVSTSRRRSCSRWPRSPTRGGGRRSPASSVCGSSGQAPTPAMSQAMARPHRLLVQGRFTEAAAAWRELGCVYEAAEAAVLSDDRDEIAAGLTVLDELGAEPLARMARRRMRAMGERVPRGPHASTRAHPAGLTRRQAQVLELLMAGAPPTRRSPTGWCSRCGPSTITSRRSSSGSGSPPVRRPCERHGVRWTTRPSVRATSGATLWHHRARGAWTRERWEQGRALTSSSHSARWDRSTRRSTGCPSRSAVGVSAWCSRRCSVPETAP
jgi:hypothetical protein